MSKDGNVSVILLQPYAKNLQGGPKTLFPWCWQLVWSSPPSQHRQNLWLFSKQLSMAKAKELADVTKVSSQKYISTEEIILWGLLTETSAKRNQAFHKPETLLSGWLKWAATLKKPMGRNFRTSRTWGTSNNNQQRAGDPGLRATFKVLKQ